MKTVIFLAAVSATNIFVGVEGSLPTPDIGMCGHTEFLVKFPNNPRIQGFDVHGSINKAVRDGTTAFVEGRVYGKKNGEWIFKSKGAILKPRDTINYRTTLRFDGQNHQSRISYTFTLPVAFPPTPTIGMCGREEYQVTLPDYPGIERFAVHVNINKELTVDAPADFNIVVKEKKNGEWIHKRQMAKLKSGDTFFYWTSVQFDGHEYRSDTTLNFTVPEGW